MLNSGAKAASSAPPRIDFNRDIRPIISARCFPCHGPDPEARKKKLRLDIRQEAIKDRGGYSAIKPGDPAGSEVIARITSTEPSDVMPPAKLGHPLSPSEIQRIKQWIQQGAEYTEHWAFAKPQRPPIPKINSPNVKVLNPIDNFIIARLSAERLPQAPPADRYTLIRRVAMDLTGLPPSPRDVEAFENDPSPDAYEKLVDRLLSSPVYGERWARMWLDLARYADSAGYGSDPLRLNIWPYRDWVIHAFNRNLPYDQFTTEQLAGDLFPHPTEDQLIATAFHRNTMTNTEGGTDREEFRVAAVKDRIATTMQVWMGLTMGCAQCHSHKFDPITQQDYYRFFAIFNETEDNDQPDERPTMAVLTSDKKERAEHLKRSIALIEKRMAAPSPQFQAELASWEKTQKQPVAWTSLEPSDVRTASGTKIVKLPDRSIGTTSPEGKETFTVETQSALSNITAFRIELLPDSSRITGKDSGGVVLNQFRVTARPAKDATKRARFLRVVLPGPERILSLAEVQVFRDGQNVALKGKASQSSTDYAGEARLAIDGNTKGDYFAAKSTTHTRIEDSPWWEVDLGAELPVERVVLWNRTDGGLGTRLVDFKVLALDASRRRVAEVRIDRPPNPSTPISLGRERLVKLSNPTADASRPGYEVDKAISSDAKTGWSPGASAHEPHAAVFEVDGDLGEPGGTILTFTLVRSSTKAGKSDARFRLSATTQKRPVRLLPTEIQSIVGTPAERRTAAQKEQLANYFRPLAPSLAKTFRELAELRKQLAGVQPVPVPVMRQLPKDKQRQTHVLLKGNFLNPGAAVDAAFPSAFPPPAGVNPNRLDVAQWLVSRDNPLTARVTVNRFWAQLLGTGLVETEEDFGTQGQLPSHPELLDWLAIEFMDNRWDVKRLLKTIVTSATYKQSSRVSAESLAKDPKARLLSRYPRRRLDAESVRDQALTVSGLLSHKIGGPSVYPPQPDGLWRAAFNGERTWATSTGEDRYRRGLYTFWRRTVPYPSMATFDAPSRENCTMRRLPTNTPLQAFVTLNDPAYVEMAQALGRRIIAEGGRSSEDRVRYALKLALARPPTDEQIQVVLKLYDEALAKYRADGEAAKKMAGSLGPFPAGTDFAERAAWTVVGNVLLNLDGVLTKG
jgi:hypothetical protein